MPPSRRALKKSISGRNNENRSSAFTKQVERQENLCWFCGEPLAGDCTREHLLARALGGTDDIENIRAAHAECNGAAGHLPVSDKMRLRNIGVNEGRAAMMILAKQLRRADSRITFQKPEPGQKYWKKLGLPGKPQWWDG